MKFKITAVVIVEQTFIVTAPHERQARQMVDSTESAVSSICYDREVILVEQLSDPVSSEVPS